MHSLISEKIPNSTTIDKDLSENPVQSNRIWTLIYPDKLVQKVLSYVSAKLGAMLNSWYYANITYQAFLSFANNSLHLTHLYTTVHLSTSSLAYQQKIYSTLALLVLYLTTFPKSNAWDFRIHNTQISEKFPMTSEHYRRRPKDSRTLPTIPKDVPMISDGCWMLRWEAQNLGTISFACYLGLKRDI